MYSQVTFFVLSQALMAISKISDINTFFFQLYPEAKSGKNPRYSCPRCEEAIGDWKAHLVHHQKDGVTNVDLLKAYCKQHYKTAGRGPIDGKEYVRRITKAARDAPTIKEAEKAVEKEVRTLCRTTGVIGFPKHIVTNAQDVQQSDFLLKKVQRLNRNNFSVLTTPYLNPV